MKPGFKSELDKREKKERKTVVKWNLVSNPETRIQIRTWQEKEKENYREIKTGFISWNQDSKKTSVKRNLVAAWQGRKKQKKAIMKWNSWSRIQNTNGYYRILFSFGALYPSSVSDTIWVITLFGVLVSTECPLSPAPSAHLDRQTNCCTCGTFWHVLIVRHVSFFCSF